MQRHHDSTAADHGGTVFAISRSLGIHPGELLDFSASINPLGPAPGVRQAVTAAFYDLVHYPDSDCTELRQALAEFHGLSPAHICVGNGSTELIYLLPRLTAGRRALIVAPPFSEYARALSRDGFTVDYFPLLPEEGFALRPERLAATLREGYDLVVLGNPGNPSGRLYPPDEVAEILRLCGGHGAYLVVDEAFMDFCEGGSAKIQATTTTGILVLRSMTKFYALPGLRLGYALSCPETIELLGTLRQPWSVNTLAQIAGVASLAATGYAETTRHLVKGERQRLMEGFSALPGLRPYPSAANYLLVEITNGPTAAGLASRLMKERLLIRDCSTFVGLDERFFRVAVRGKEENERLLLLMEGVLREG